MLFFANWKLNGNLKFIEEYIGTLSEKIKINENDKLVLCPPFPYISFLKNLIDKNNLKNLYVAAQNCSEYDKGAYTGEVSVKMLRDIGVKYVIIGHSERRYTFLEKDIEIYRKFQIILENGLIPVLCIGERDSSLFREQISQQCAYLDRYAFENETAILAYEPVWAIGSGSVASISYIENSFSVINECLDSNIKIIYGGSVNCENIKEMKQIKNIAGFLVGGASLLVDNICNMLV